MPATIEGLTLYADLRGVTVPQTTESQQALQRGSDYVRTRYVLRQYASNHEAALERPNTIEAIYIAAMQELVTPNFWSKTYELDDTKILTRAEGIGWTPVDTGVKGADALMPVSPMIEALMQRTGFVGGGFVV